jgi:hypothetical protein
MGLPVVTLKRPGNPKGRILKTLPLYDTEGIAAAATSQVRFFTNPLNSADASATFASKTYAETNLIQAGQIPKGFTFIMTGINLKWFNNVAGTPLIRIDDDKMFLRSWYEFSISEILIVRVQGSEMPFGNAPEAFGTTTADTKLVWNMGVAHRSNVLDCGVKGRYPTITENEGFTATLNYGAAITPSVAINVQNILQGLLFKPL